MEYVTKKEIKPYKQIFAKAIENIRDDIRKEGITFICRLVGSSKRNLVIKDDNKGFDCDYQIILQKNKKNLEPKEIKNLFSTLLKNELINYRFNPSNDSTSSITFRKVDQENSKRIFSYDVVILRGNEVKLEILRVDKEVEPNIYKFELLPDMTNSITNTNFKKIIGPNMWKTLRKNYLNKKIQYKNNNIERKSFQILNETVNEILNNTFL